ncbi:WD40 repeat domain-containing serine/threonine protein kinase [Cryptosporangium arvum]|uniref:WD40 repeat domain-containing serine/threonine protein kinase n=1 Tax=Cryptosporangium arvum TaxID=80871 RepID=UPI0004AF2F40|nr:serine/threonine-protein kinase [Cryptosporangium arvum]
MIIDRAQLVVALPQYEIGDVLGRGAHGLVFHARHRRLGSAHAVKALVVAERDLDASRRFLNEARVMTALDHPHIVRVNEYAEGDAVLLLVLEHLGGGTLTERMGQPVAPGVASAWMLAVAEALSVAHHQGVVHRDIKPANLLFTTGGLLKVGDFGISKLFAGSDASASADIVGTPRYIAPEQISGGRIGPATDLYALGVTFYELLSGKSPFPVGLSLPGLLHHHLSMPPEPLEGAPPALAALVERLLEKDPAARPDSARGLAVELVNAAEEDLGGDWITRSGVPLRIDGALLYQRGPWRELNESRVPPREPGRGRSDTPVPPSSRTVLLGDEPLPPLPVVSGGGTGGDPDWVRTGDRDESPRPEPRVPAGRRRAMLAGAAAVVVVATATAATLVLNADRSADASHTATTATAQKTATAEHSATLLGEFTAGRSIAERVAIDGDATHVAWITTGGDVSVWDPATERQVGPLGGTDTAVWAAAFVVDDDPTLAGPSGGVLLTGGQDGVLHQWDPGTGREAGATVPVGPEKTIAVAFDQDGATMAAGGADGVVRIWNAITVEPSDPPLRGHTSPIAAIAFAPTGTRIATAADDGVRLWNAGSHQQVVFQSNRGGAVTTSLAFSPDGSRLVSGGFKNAVQLWDAQSGRPVGPAIDPGPTDLSIALGFSRDSDALITCAGNVVRWWDASTGKRTGAEVRLPASAPVSAAAFTANGTHVVTASTDGTVRLWKLV